MCGIVGYISGAGTKGWPQDRAKFIRQGLVVDSLRGMDSTGIFTVEAGKEKESPYWLKQAVNGGRFVTTKKYDEAMYQPSSFRAVIGHNRAATLGAVNTDNAHPFQEGPITLVHNGTLTSTAGMPLPLHQLRKSEGVDVDSHAIAHNLAHSDIREWYRKMHGAWVLVWHDSRDGAIRIVRNHQRPVHVAKLRNEETLLICSEADMLAFVATRATMQFEDVYSLRPDYMFTWFPDTPVLEPESEELERDYSSWGATSYYGGRKYTQAQNGVLYPEESSRGSAHTDVPFADNNVLLCGNMRPVPEAHQEQLLSYDLLVEARPGFKPWEVMAGSLHNRTPITVTGWLEDLDLPAVVHGVPSYLHSSAGSNKETWKVKPVGMFYPDCDPEDDETDMGAWVICRFVSSFYQKPKKEAPVKDEDIMMARGPKGVRMSVSEFNTLIDGGCITCNSQLSFLDDEDMSWTEDCMPICPDCTAQKRMVN